MFAWVSIFDAVYTFLCVSCMLWRLLLFELTPSKKSFVSLYYQFLVTYFFYLVQLRNYFICHRLHRFAIFRNVLHHCKIFTDISMVKLSLIKIVGYRRYKLFVIIQTNKIFFDYKFNIFLQQSLIHFERFLLPAYFFRTLSCDTCQICSYQIAFFVLTINMFQLF